VRWSVAGKENSQTFERKTQAERYKSRLMAAAEHEAFDVETGLPDSMRRESSSKTWYELACAYIDAKWPKLSAKGRSSVVEGLQAVTVVLVKNTRGAPDPAVLRKALRRWAFNPLHRDEPMPSEVEKALRWAAKVSVPVSALEESNVITKALDACAKNLDGKQSAPEYYRRRRRTLYGALKYAVREKHLSANPLDNRDERDWTAPEVVQELDRRRVPNPKQVGELLKALGNVGRTQGPRLVALYGCMYYGLLRPSEAVNLRADWCKLPEEGWGLIELDQVKTVAGREWTDGGEVHDTRGLKGRPKDTVRRVPIPPELVTLIRHHLDEYGTGPDARLFPTQGRGRPELDPLAGPRQGTKAAFTEAQYKSPLAPRPYDSGMRGS
jgi:integrase